MSGASREHAGFLVKSEGMQAANPNCAVRCSMDTPAVFDEEQIKCELAAQVLKDSGMLRLRASGSSMLPSVWPGDILTIRPQSFERWRPGDIALYMAISRSTCVQATSSFTVSLLCRIQETS